MKSVEECPVSFKYVNPLHKGKPQFVPVVAKNRDELVGLINGYSSVIEISGQVILFKILSDLTGSHRYSAVLHEDFEVSKHTLNELVAYVQDRVTRTLDLLDKESDYSIYDDYLLPVSCTCGSFYGFKDFTDIPEEDFDCVDCGRAVIQYIGHSDEDLTVDPIVTSERLPININEIYSDIIEIEQESRDGASRDN